MNSTLVSKIASVCVVLILVLCVVVPVIDNINKSTSEQTETISYGTNSMAPYTEIIGESILGDIDNEYSVSRGDFNTSTGAFTDNSSGAYLKVYSYVADLITYYASIDDTIYWSKDGSGFSYSDLNTLSYPATVPAYGQTWKLSLNGLNNQIVEITVDAVQNGAYMVVPYDVEYYVPTETVYADNTIQSTTISGVLGTMSGTTFTADPTGDYLSIPLYIFNNSPSNTYAVEEGATIYAPDTSGDLAAFTVTSGAVSGLNSAITATFSLDTSIVGATAYDLSVSTTNTDLPDIIIPKEIAATTLVPITNPVKVTMEGTTAVLMSNGDLYCTGTGYYDGTYATIHQLTLYATNVADFVLDNWGGGFILDTDHDLYCIGTKYGGGFGDNVSGSSEHTTLYKVASNVAKVVTVYGSSYYISTTGDLYVTGTNAKGQLGLGHTNGVSTWTLSKSGVQDVFGHDVPNKECCFVLANDDKIYAAGYNADGQLGLGDTNNRSSWTDTGLTNATSIKCAGAYTMALCGNTLYGAGKNSHYVLGITGDSSYTSWTQTATGVAKICMTGNIASAYISTNGELYMAGSYYQGYPTTDIPWTLIASNITDFSGDAGIWFYLDSSHKLYVTASYNPSGAAGVGNTNTVDTWTLTANNVSSLFPQHLNEDSGYIGTDGKVYVAGTDNSGALGTNGNAALSWTPMGLPSTTVIATNTVETKTLSDQRGTMSGTTFTPSASGTYLQIPLVNAGQYTYYIGDGATYYGPDSTDTLTLFTAPSSTGINTGVALTFTDMGATYDNTLNALTASVTDSDLKGLVIPYTATYTAQVATHYDYNWYGDSDTFVFTEDPNGSYIKVPGAVLQIYTYYIDDEATYYAESAADTLTSFEVPSSTGIYGITVTFTPSVDLEDVYELTGSGTGFVIVPRSYGDSLYNTTHTITQTYTPIRGNVSGTTFTEAADGTYLKVFKENVAHTTYQIGDERTYYTATGSTLTAVIAPTVPIDTDFGITFTEAVDDENVYDIGGSITGATNTLIVPYEVTYDITTTVTTEKIPMLSLVPLVLIIICLIFVAGLIYIDRRGY